MKVLITGANGFIGKNLIAHLQNRKDIEIVKFDKDDHIEDYKTILPSIDFIFHFAGVNRPQNADEFYKGNTDLTKQIISMINDLNLSIPILFTSSIQVEKSNDYGKSKKMAENILEEYGKKNRIYLFRLHNVFGKLSRPNYNSVVATFCYNIANNQEITINDESTIVPLIYIDDVVHEFIKAMDNQLEEAPIYHVEPIYTRTLKEIADTLYQFKNCIETINVPATGDEFTKKLFATYSSYIPIDDSKSTIKMNIDERGSFSELIKTEHSGQFSISTSKPGIVRGNHYHHTKMERFIVVKGKAKISFRKIDEDKIYEYIVDETKLEIVTIIPGYTHSIENIGDNEMVLAIWCNELFDSNNPDTYYMEVYKNE